MKEFVQTIPCTTYSGVSIYYGEPTRTRILEADLIHHLQDRRYNGAIDVSILQHLALCVRLARSRGYGEVQTACCAVHDIHEAYLRDIPAGLKQLLPDYRRLEEIWEAHIWNVAGLSMTPDNVEAVKRIDQLALVIEMEYHSHPLLSVAEGYVELKAELGDARIIGELDLRSGCEWGIISDAILSGGIRFWENNPWDE